MPPKPPLSSLILILFQTLVDRATFYLTALPNWDYFGYRASWGCGYNFIPAGSMQSHVTGIELDLTHTEAIYSVKILGHSATSPAVPLSGCSALSDKFFSGTNHHI